MNINLTILKHQNECLEKINKVFSNVYLKNINNFSNPIFDTSDINLNINLK